ncbi:MAG: peptidylprolyl isomerase [Planctomycetota bacterium]
MGRIIFLVLVVVLSLTGCDTDKTGQSGLTAEQIEQVPIVPQKTLPHASGGFVLAVGGETITSDEIIYPVLWQLAPLARGSDFESFMAKASGPLEQMVMSRISNLLLYNMAKADAGENFEDVLEKAADAEVKKFIARYGNDYAKAEYAIKQRGMDWESFKDYQKKMIISQSYVSSQLTETEPITYSELVNAYSAMKDTVFTKKPFVTFRLIDIEPAKLEVSDTNKPAVQQARELAANIVRKINEGQDFAELAKQYSHGYRRDFGGLWEPREPDSLASPYDILATTAENMQPGRTTQPIEAGGHIFIMRLEAKQAGSVEPFEQVQDQLEERILFDRRKKAIEKLESKLIEQAALANRRAFLDFCLRKIYELSNQQN